MTEKGDSLDVRGVAGKYIVERSRVYTSLDQDFILTTEDKLTLALHRHLEVVERRKEWMTPLGILVTILVAFATAEFRDALYLKAAVWQATYLIGAVGSTVWLVRSLIQARESSSIADIIAHIKQTSLVQAPLTEVSDFPILSGSVGSFAHERNGPWQEPVLCNPVHRAWEAALAQITGARWVWIKERPSDDEATNGQVVYHKLEFCAPSVVQSATILLCVDNHVTLYVNEKFVSKVKMNEGVVEVDIGPHVHGGENSVLMQVENSPGPGGGIGNPSGVIYVAVLGTVYYFTYSTSSEVE